MTTARSRRTATHALTIRPAAGFVAALALALALAAPAVAKPACRGYTAEIKGTNTVSIGGASQTWEQRMLLYKRTGKGIVGNWVGTIHEQIITNSYPMPAEAAKAMRSVPTTVVPGVKATCETTVPNAYTIKVRCEGAYPFKVDAKGKVYWRGRKTPIGSVESVTAVPPVRITLDMLKGAPNVQNPGFNSAMTGLISGAHNFGLEPSVERTRLSTPNHPSDWSELKVVIRREKPGLGKMENLTAKATFTGDGIEPVWTQKQANGEITLTARLNGRRLERQKLAAKITISATAVIDGCKVSSSWNLLDLALVKNVSP